MPATAADAKGLMKASIRDDGPVVFMQHRLLGDFEEAVPDGDHVVPLGTAAVKREGADVTVVAVSYALPKTLQAAQSLDPEIGVEVIDPRTLVPLDVDTIIRSVKKTGRLLVVHEAPARGGVGAEIVRQVTEKGFELLREPPRVLGGLNTPMPYSAPLEDACLPQPEDIAAAIRSSVRA